VYAPLPSPIRAACPADLIRLALITYTCVNSKDWVKLQLSSFLHVHCLRYVIYLWDLSFSQRRFRGFKSFALRLCCCVSGSRRFERGYYGPSKRRKSLTKRLSVLSQKIWILNLQLVYT
jgi:hypothetical protein